MNLSRMSRNMRDGYTIVAFVEVKKEVPGEEGYHASGTERGVVAVLLFLSLTGSRMALAQGGLHRVNHIIIVMQENHSFDNYFGALAYAPGALITTRTAPACQVTTSA